MRRTLLLATLIAVIAVPQSFASTGWIKSLATAQKQAKDKNAYIFVDLFAQWCGWCHRFEQEVYPSEAFQKSTAKMVLLRLDTEDGADGTRFAQKYQVTSLPTFLILNSDMSIVGSIRGYAPPNEFVKMIDETIGKYKSFLQMAATENTFASDYQKRLELAKQFVGRQNYPAAEPRLRKLTMEPGVPVKVRDEAYYELAIVYLVEGKYDDVKKTMSAFARVQSQGDLYERTQLLSYDICLAQQNLRCAVDELKSFKQRFPNSQLIPNIDQMLPSIEQQLGPSGPVKQQ